MTTSTLGASVLVILLGLASPSRAQMPVSFGAPLTLTTGSLPIAVATGDVNGDGNPDLIAVNTGANTVSVLLGTGAGSFGPKTDFATGAVPHGVAVADLNGDGHRDIAVANTGAGTVSVLLGTGTGSFGGATDFPTGAAPFFVAIGDLDGDGISDVVTVNVNADTVSVLLGRGDGSFGPKTDFPTGAGAREVAIGDLNRDGVPDLVVANVNASTVSVLLGTGEGQFGPKTDFATGAGARAVAVGDVNGDGFLDVMVANQNANTVSVLLGTGTGTVGPKTDFTTGAGPRAVAISDVNRDGRPDLVVANFNANTVSVLLGVGDGTFTAKTDFGTETGPFSLAIDDLNGDGKPDLVVADVNANALTVLVNSTPMDVLTVQTGSGSGTVTGNLPGIACANGCSAPFARGTAVRLRATPAPGSIFTGWNGGGCTGTDACTVTLAADTTVTASFAEPAPSDVLVAAILPSSRSVRVRTAASAFAILINAGAATASSCTLGPSRTLPATFTFQTTDPTTNQVTGTPNSPIDIPAGAARTFVFSFTPTAPIASTDVALTLACVNPGAARAISGLNTLLLSASATPVPDVVALAATLDNDGIVNIPGAAGTGVFSVATVNVGAGAPITVSADTGSASLPVAVSVCQTNPSTGFCLAPPSPSVTTQIDASSTPAFGVFVTGGDAVPFNPASTRVFIRFSDASGVTRGLTSVAVRTQ